MPHISSLSLHPQLHPYLAPPPPPPPALLLFISTSAADDDSENRLVEEIKERNQDMISREKKYTQKCDGARPPR